MAELTEYQKVIHYIFSTDSIVDTTIIHRFTHIATDLFISFTTFVTSLLYFILYSTIILTKVTVIIFPYVINITNNVYDFHRKQLTFREIIYEFVFITFCIVYFVFRKRIQKSIKTIQLYVSKKSKAAARVFPHVLFIASTLSISILFHKILVKLTTTYTQPVFTLLIPLLHTIKCLHSTTISAHNIDMQHIHVLELWILLAIYHSVATIFTTIRISIPFFYFFTSKIIFLKQFVIITIFWIQLSPSITDIVLELIEPLKTVITNIPSLQLQSLSLSSSSKTSLSQSNFILYFLKSIGLLSPVYETFLLNLFQDIVALIFTAAFMFTPFGKIGVVIVALLIPAFKSLI